MISLEKKIETLAKLIVDSKDILALTGAGMSTESGVPDFRSPEAGLWNKFEPDEVASVHSYVSDTHKNLDFMFELGKTIFLAKANTGHKALTKLQKMGKLSGILTQNIDNLHQKAHTKNILELHGNVNEAICMTCNKIYPITIMINQYLKEGITPYCLECDGLLKPNAILFGEPLGSDILEQADKMIEKCDLLLILGSSLVVYPVAFYPFKAIEEGKKIAIINIQKTDIDDQAEVVIHEKIGDILPKVVELVEKMMYS